MEKPELDTWVKVTTDYTDAKHGQHWVTMRRYEHIGKVVKLQEWEDSEACFGLLTNDENMRLKTINMKFVSKIEQLKTVDIAQVDLTQTVAEEKEPERKFEIKSSRGDKKYTVTKDKFSWTCTCEAGQRGRRCKHVAEAQALLKAEKVS